MHARTFLLLIVAGAASIGQACGSTDATPGASDAGGDVVESGSEAAAPVDSGCDPNADFTQKIPDAAIGDSGASTGVCVACVLAKCPQQVAACDRACACQGVAASALSCYVKNESNPLLCASQFTTVDQSTQVIGFALFACVNSACKGECATSSFEDGGKDSGGD
jgi:hypothetical protein